MPRSVHAPHLTARRQGHTRRTPTAGRLPEPVDQHHRPAITPTTRTLTLTRTAGAVNARGSDRGSGREDALAMQAHTTPCWPSDPAGTEPTPPAGCAGHLRRHPRR